MNYIWHSANLCRKEPDAVGKKGSAMKGKENDYDIGRKDTKIERALS